MYVEAITHDLSLHELTIKGEVTKKLEFHWIRLNTDIDDMFSGLCRIVRYDFHYFQCSVDRF